ncbi:uncharacterized protein [Spinacia oleracea]|uniref:Reverse transcriptase domain-containing protein n=1 Tax=Spinacia oleracea TaxID=3562 RepID=A0ABM3RJN4_SPIOL|nr:uncharacterized protein LOC130470192 [Spinacia oleracea]
MKLNYLVMQAFVTKCCNVAVNWNINENAIYVFKANLSLIHDDILNSGFHVWFAPVCVKANVHGTVLRLLLLWLTRNPNSGKLVTRLKLILVRHSVHKPKPYDEPIAFSCFGPEGSVPVASIPAVNDAEVYCSSQNVLSCSSITRTSVVVVFRTGFISNFLPHLYNFLLFTSFMIVPLMYFVFYPGTLSSWKKFYIKQWLTQGDRNSSFFHQRTKTIIARNTIFRLKNEVGLWESDPKDVSDILLTSFKQRFKSIQAPNRSIDLSFLPSFVSEQEQENLILPYSEEEIKNAFLDMNPDKSPGSDGFGPKFFQAYWPIVGKEVTSAIQGFFYHGKIPRFLNHTIIALIPKNDNPENPNHFRPISLCNTIYKAIAKLIVNRLSPILKNHMSPFQNAFTPERSIHDNLLIVQEVLNTFQKSNSKIGWCALKLDMEKAYDRIEWDFLWATLEAFGFPSQWIQWVKACVTSVSYSLKINGATTEHFSPSRGVRQGDPLSPYLFILCMEVFIFMLNLKTSNPKNGVRIKVAPGSPKIPCLLFADDSLLFCKATNSACQILRNTINDFCTLSGQLVNFHKSAIVFSKHVSNNRKDNTNFFSMTKSMSLGRYLGIHFSAYKPTKRDFAAILQKNETRINAWHANYLSKAGRTILIQSNLEALPAYVCSSFLLPQKTCQNLDSAHRNFFWKQTFKSNSTPLISWDTICKPKSLGGLGLRRTRPLNKAFLAKLGWKILQDNNNLWTSIVRKKYLSNTSFFNCKPNPQQSQIWRDILKQRDILRKGIRWKIGNGKDINFWLDNWAMKKSLLTALNKSVDIVDTELMVADFILPSKEWDLPKLLTFLPLSLVQKIKGIAIPSLDIIDTPIWGPTTSGEFSVKSATWIAHDIPDGLARWEYRWIWNLDIPPKIQIFLWQICHNSIPTRDILFQRKILPFNVCPLCDTYIESINHLFIQCPTAKQIWNLDHTKKWLDFSIPFCDFFETIDYLRKYQQTLCKFLFIIWTLWKERNDCIFNNCNFNTFRVFCKANFYFKEWQVRTNIDQHQLKGTPLTSHTHTIITHNPPVLVRWYPPPQGTFKLNFDGSCNSSSAAVGFIIRDNNGTVISIRTYNLGITQAFMAEACALHKGLKEARNLNIKNIYIEGDNLLVINVVKGTWNIPWKLHYIIQDIQDILKFFDTWDIKHVFREANRAADWVANVGHLVSDTMGFEPCNSSHLLSILDSDYLGELLVRRGS